MTYKELKDNFYKRKKEEEEEEKKKASESSSKKSSSKSKEDNTSYRVNYSDIKERNQDKVLQKNLRDLDEKSKNYASYSENSYNNMDYSNALSSKKNNSSAYNSLRNTSDSVRKYYEDNKSKMSLEDYDNAIKYLNDLNSGSDTLREGIRDKSSALLSSFASEQEYKGYLASEKKNEELKKANVDELSRELSSIDDHIETLKRDFKTYEDNYKANNGIIPDMTTRNALTQDQIDRAKTYTQLKSSTDKRIAELEKERSDKESYLNEAKTVQADTLYQNSVNEILKNPDYNNFVTSGKTSYENDIATQNQIEEDNKEEESFFDKLGRYLGEGGGTTDTSLPTSATTNVINSEYQGLGEDYKYGVTDKWTLGQKSNFYAIYSQDKELAKEYAYKTNLEIKQNETAGTLQKISNLSESNALINVFGSLAGIPMATATDTQRQLLGGVLGTVGGIVTSAFAGDKALLYLTEMNSKGYIDDYTKASLTSSDISSAFQSGVAKGIEEATNGNGTMLSDVLSFAGQGASAQALKMSGNDTPLSDFTIKTPLGDLKFGNVYSKLYNTGFSALQSYAIMSTLGPAGTLALGSGAASSTMDDALERGLSNDQAVTLGVLSGIFEGLFEELSFDKLINIENPANIAQALKNTLIQGGVEASEETFTTIANTVADLIVSGDKSEIATNIATYMAMGMDESSANKQAILDFLSGLIDDAMGGFLSGGAMASVSQLAGVVSESYRTGVLYGDSASELVAEGLLSAQGTNSRALAEANQKKLDAGKKLSNSDIYKQVRANEEAFKNETETDTVTQETANNEAETVNDTFNRDSIETPVEMAESAPEQTIEEAINSINNKRIDKATIDQIKSEYDGSISAADFVEGMLNGFEYGYSGTPRESISTESSWNKLNDVQKDHAYRLGESKRKGDIKARGEQIQSGANGKTGWRRGTVKGVNVKLAEVKKAFNDQQNKAYKVLDEVAKATGMDIALYKSGTNENGEYTEAQGKFKRSDNTIYIDINAGLKNNMDVNDLGKYAMLRTFTHEVTHRGEWWAPEEYDSLKNIVYNQLNENGENVDELIRIKMAEGNLDYIKASNEVVAEAMTDILPQSTFIQQLAEEKPNIFKKFIAKLKEFINNIKEYFNSIGHNTSREANSLKEERDGQLKYLQDIVDAWDKMQVAATKNYQLNFAVNEKVAKEQTNTKTSSEESTKDVEIVETPVEESTEDTTVEAESDTIASDNGYTITKNTEYGSLEVAFDSKPSEAIREVLKAKKFRWNGKKGVWYGKTNIEDLNNALDYAYEKEGKKEADVSEVKEYTDVEKTEIAEAMKENTGNMSSALPTQIESTEETPAPVVDNTASEPASDTEVNTRGAALAAKIIKGTTKKSSLSTAGIEDNGHYFLGNGAVLAVVDKTTYNNADVSVKVSRQLYDSLNALTNKITSPAYKCGDNIIAFNVSGSPIVLTEKYAKWFDGYDFYYNPDVKNTPLAIKDGDTLVGVILPVNFNGNINFDTAEIVKMKSFDKYINKEAGNNGEQVRKINEGTVSQSDTDRSGDTRLLDEVQEEDVRGDVSSREHLQSAETGIGETGRNDNRADAERNGSGRSDGSSEVGDLRRDGELLSPEETAARDYAKEKGFTISENPLSKKHGTLQIDIKTPDGLAYRIDPVRINKSSDWTKVIDKINSYIESEEKKSEQLSETVDQQVQEQSKETPKGSNFVINDSLNLPDGEKARFRANIDAIKLVKQLEAEGRYATAAEQEVLSKYVGWGGLSNAFGDLVFNRETRKSEMTAKKGWENEFAEFRKLVDDGIITEDEYKEASASTKNAHYTSIEVIKAMYNGLNQLGFNGGRMLEPSSGVGNFVGAMPVDMSNKVTSWTMVELDSITGNIAKYLYPNADVRVQGFEKANIPNNYMDVAIGNVPFGNYGIVDKTYPNRVKKAIHNYFFAKSIDKVRPGGIVMFITSSFTMNGADNSVRQYIMDRADLIGAIRLPNTAFKGNAGTEVVTDILVLKKRKPGTEYAGEAFLEAPRIKPSENSYQTANINEYFTNHPEMVLGIVEFKRGMYGADSLTYAPLEGKGTLDTQIVEAFKNIKTKMDYEAKVTPEKANFNAQRADRKTKNNGLVSKDGKIYKNDNGTLIEQSLNEKDAKKVSDILSIRDSYKQLINYIQQGQAENLIKSARKQLNKFYDDFVKANGYLNDSKNKKLFEADPDHYSILSLENYDSKTKKATKADIFTKDTIKPNRTVTNVASIADGVIVSLNTLGRVDAEYIAKLTGRTAEDITRELIDIKAAFKTSNGTLEAPETYLSGNVRAKLRDAEALAPLDKDYKNNVEELKKVIPKDIPYNDIYVTPGTPWIPVEVYADFIAEMLGGYNNANSYGGPDVVVAKNATTGDYTVQLNNSRLKSKFNNTQKWGTNRRTFLNIIQAMMSNGSLTVSDTFENAEGKKVSVINKVETEAVQEKAKEITAEFQRWLWDNESRRTELASLYNETFNALVTPKYSGKNLTVNGLNAAFDLRDHQADAVQRIISSGGNTLLAHRVGAGKTLEMASAAMKLRELGIVKKPMFAVPKSLVAQWGVEFKSYFPAARLLVADEKSFTKTNRKIFANQIANGDYDAIIVSYEQFEKVPMSPEFQKEFYQQQINEIITAVAEEKAESRDGKGLTVKEMEKKRAQLEKKIQELTSKEKDEENIDFEQLGIDSLFVDEAHNFKNLQYVTRMNNVAGLGNTNGSQRAFDLYTKIRYLQGLNGGRGIVFATATPVMNSMSEMYIMQKYLQSDMLNELGLNTFDAWAKQFGEVTSSLEVKPSGQGYRKKQTFANFKNLNELQLLFRSFSDVLTDVPGLKIPKMKGGQVQIVECEPGEFQKNYMKELEKRAQNVKNVDASVDNMLKITSDGRKVSYTQRMIDPTLPYEAGSKIFKCCDNVINEYKASKSIKGTQIVFCDMATPKGKAKTETNTDVDESELDTESARLYDDMKAYLIKKGIPANEIAFIHDAVTDQQRKQLFADVNAGKVRVLIGSTGKMGVGMNAQERIVAIHHLDAPWRPGDVEQRDGRAFRQKNMNEEVSKYVYVTKGSFDARLWDILNRKQNFINQIMNGNDVGRSAEDTGDVTLSAAEVMAVASGNPLIKESVELTNEIQTLESLLQAHNSAVLTARSKMQKDTQIIASINKDIEKVNADIKKRTNTYSDDTFSITIDGKKFTNKKDAGIALVTAAETKTIEGEFVQVGNFAGFELWVMKTGAEYVGQIVGNLNYKFNVYTSNTTHMINNLAETIATLEYRSDNWQSTLDDTKADLAAQEKAVNEPFNKQAELDKKRARFNEVMAILNPAEEQQTASDDDVQEQARNYLGDEDTQYQERTSPLTNRELLSMARENIPTSDLTDGEMTALNVFNKRLDKLTDLETKRAELGKLYKEQQFGSKVDRTAAAETLNRMHILDSQIKTASNEVLDVEEKEVLKRVLTKARKIAEQQERLRGKEILNNWRAKRKETDAVKKYKERIKADVDDLTNWLLKPDNKEVTKHIPDVLKNTVVDFLSSIDLTSDRKLRGGEATKADIKFVERLNKLKDAIKNNITVNGLYSGYNDLPEGFMDELQNIIDVTNKYINNQIGDFVLNRMTSEELKNLARIVKQVKRFVKHMNEFHENAVYQHVYEAGNNSYTTLAKMKKASSHTGGVSNFLLWENMRPAYAFERFGEGGKAIYDEFRRAQSKLAYNAKQIIDFSNETYTSKEVNDWEKEEKTFTFGDDEVRVPVSYLMGLYELSKQPDSLRHILGEGLRVATYKMNGKAKISDVGHQLTAADVATMIDSLTDRQKEVADKLQKYMATVGAEWGNYVSVKRFGEQKFTNPLYYPINSDGRHIDNNMEEAPSNASLYALLNMSFTKARNEEANNRIILYSIFDVFANHMASMAQYNAFALPVLDALKWFNYKSTTEDENGKRIVLGSLREELSRVYGVPEENRPGSGKTGYAERFITNIIKAYNGTETQGIPSDSLGLKMMRQYNMAQIAYNLRVVIQQPMAITRAGLLISYNSIRKAFSLKPSTIKSSIDEMNAHSGIAQWKSLGFYDTNISRGLTDTIKHKQSAMETINEVGMTLAEKADEYTWATMWRACKEEINATNRYTPGTDEYYEAVTQLFEEVVYKTQVVDSVLTKTEMMRSKGFFSRAISSFMSEPSTTASMLLSAYDNYATDINNGMARSEAWKKNKALIARTAAVYAISAITLAAVQSIIDGMRDDDDDPYGEKYLDAFVGNVIDELMPVNKLPFLSDFYDVAKELMSKFGVDTYGNPPQTIMMQWYDSLMKATDILQMKISGSKTGYTWYGGIQKLLQAVSGMTGLPINSLTREVVTAWNNSVGAIDTNMKILKYKSTKK